MQRAAIALLIALAPAPVLAAKGDTVTATIAGKGITGTVTMTETASGTVLVVVEAAGVPAGAHGFHVHEKGMCDPATGFESAGGHLARGMSHGLAEGGPHPGDFPNVHVQADGVLRVEFFTRGFSLDAQGEQRLLDEDGSAVVLHADADDYTSQPSGKAGARIACGVIEKKGR